MFPINQREMQKAMKRMGIKQEEIPALQVIIRLEDKDIVVDEPQVSKVNMMGSETFQVTGKVSEQRRDTSVEISDDDISTVVSQTGCSEERAREVLTEVNGNIAEAIMKLSE